MRPPWGGWLGVNMQVVTHEELAEVIERLGEELKMHMVEAAKAAQKPEYYTRAEAAEYLRMGESTLDKLAVKGEIRRAKIGGTVLYRKVDLDEFVEDQLEMDAEEARRIVRNTREN